MVKNSSEYNKQYYIKNKERIAEKLYKKVECPYCNRIVNFQNLVKHQETILCYRRSKIKTKHQHQSELNEDEDK